MYIILCICIIAHQTSRGQTATATVAVVRHCSADTSSGWWFTVAWTTVPQRFRCVVRLHFRLLLVSAPHVQCARRKRTRHDAYDDRSGGDYEEKDATTGRGESLSAMHVSKFRRLTSVDRKRGGHTDLIARMPDRRTRRSSADVRWCR